MPWHLMPVARCQLMQTLFSRVSTSTACRILGRLALSGSVAPQPATTARSPAGTGGQGSGKHTGDTCGMRRAARSSFSRARS